MDPPWSSMNPMAKALAPLLPWGAKPSRRRLPCALTPSPAISRASRPAGSHLCCLGSNKRVKKWLVKTPSWKKLAHITTHLLRRLWCSWLGWLSLISSMYRLTCQRPSFPVPFSIPGLQDNAHLLTSKLDASGSELNAAPMFLTETRTCMCINQKKPRKVLQDSRSGTYVSVCMQFNIEPDKHSISFYWILDYIQ